VPVKNDLRPLYDILRPLASQPECKSCKLCEEHVGLVYLLGKEATRSVDQGIPVSISSRGSQYLARTSKGWCAAFDPASNLCRIYNDRPLCCRLYPLDLMRLDGDVWWVIHAECPIAQRFQRDRHLEILTALTISLERTLSDEQLQSWLTTDRTSQNIEAFSSTRPNVIRLRRFGRSLSFP
jgi:Fe-S-cluster containining protein